MTKDQYAELLAPYAEVDDFSTSSLLKEKGDNLTSEKLAKLSIEDMVKTILAKSGIVSFTRVLRIIKDALIVQGQLTMLNKDYIIEHLFDNSAFIIPDSQSFIALSSLVFPESQRMQHIRDAMIVQLLKSGTIDIQQMMKDAQCTYTYLKPIVETVADTDKVTKALKIKTFADELLDEQYEQAFEEESARFVQAFKQME